MDNTNNTNANDLLVERLSAFMRYKGYTQAEFEKKARLSFENVREKGISVTRFRNLYATFPELNSKWLVSGSGEMIIDLTISAKERIARSKEVILRLTNLDLIKSQKDLCEKLDMNETMLSTEVNTFGFKDKTIQKLKALFPNFNEKCLLRKTEPLFLDEQKPEPVYDLPDETILEQLKTANRLNDGLMLQNQSLIEELQRQGERIDKILDLLNNCKFPANKELSITNNL